MSLDQAIKSYGKQFTTIVAVKELSAFLCMEQYRSDAGIENLFTALKGESGLLRDLHAINVKERHTNNNLKELTEKRKALTASPKKDMPEIRKAIEVIVESSRALKVIQEEKAKMLKENPFLNKLYNMSGIGLMDLYKSSPEIECKLYDHLERFFEGIGDFYNLQKLYQIASSKYSSITGATSYKYLEKEKSLLDRSEYFRKECGKKYILNLNLDLALTYNNFARSDKFLQLQNSLPIEEQCFISLASFAGVNNFFGIEILLAKPQIISFIENGLDNYQADFPLNVFSIKRNIAILKENWSEVTKLTKDAIDKQGLEKQMVIRKAICSLSLKGHLDKALDILDMFYDNPKKEMLDSNFALLLFFEFKVFEKFGRYEEADLRLSRLFEIYEKGTSLLVIRAINEASYIRYLNLIENKEYESAKKIIKYLNPDIRHKESTLLDRLIEEEKSEDIVNITISKIEDILLNDIIKLVYLREKSQESQIEESDYVTSRKISALLPRDVKSFLHIVDTEQLDFVQMPGSLIHAYYQIKKSIESYDALDMNKLSSSPIWNIKGKEFNAKSPEIVKLSNIGNYYCTIDPELEHHDVFDRALGKGRIVRSKGQEGVKFLGNIFELKTTSEELGDIRLYAEEVFLDNFGNHLIKFNKIGTHSDIKRKAKESKSVIEVDASVKLQDMGHAYYSSVDSAIQEIYDITLGNISDFSYYAGDIYSDDESALMGE